MVWGRKSASPMTPDEVGKAWRRALRAAVVEDWATAESWLERIVAADTRDLDAYHALARLYRKQDAIGRAIRMHQNLLLRAELSKQARIDALFELARDFEEGGFTDRAAASYEEVLGHQPRHLPSIERLIPLLKEMREYARALSLLRRLRRHKRDLADQLETDLLLSQARALADEGNQEGSRQALKRCLRRDKQCAAAYALLGELEAERGKTARALAAWKRAATADAVTAQQLYTKIAASYSARGKSEEFGEFLRGLLELRPTDSAARIALARALGSQGVNHAAVEELARAIEVSPDELALRAELGRQLIAAGNDAEALKAYAELVERIERMDSEQETLV